VESSTSALSDRVRDLVRQRRIDPRTDASSVRQAALDVIAEHESRSLTGAVRSLDEPELVIGPSRSFVHNHDLRKGVRREPLRQNHLYAL
jgi:hypothetical protein